MSQLVFIKRARATMDANEKGRSLTAIGIRINHANPPTHARVRVAAEKVLV